MKTFDAFHFDPTDRPWVSEEARRTVSLRIAFRGLSLPQFMKTFDAFHFDPTDRPWVSEEALRTVCEDVSETITKKKKKKVVFNEN